MRNKIILFLIGIVFLASTAIAIQWGGPSGTYFTTLGEGWNCRHLGDSSFWVNATDQEDSLNDCYRENGYPTTDCCPDGWTCDSSGICQPDEIYYCYQLLNKEDCNSPSAGVAERTIERFVNDTDFCNGRQFFDESIGSWVQVTSCLCFWNNTAVDTGQYCDARYNTKRVNYDDGTSDDSGFCIIDFLSVIDNCDEDGYIYYNTSATWSGTQNVLMDDCKSGTDSVPCGGPLVKLPFFTFINLVLVALILAVFYYFKKRKHR